MAAPSAAIEKPGASWQPEKLPPFPAVAMKALTLIAGADTSLLDLCNVVRSDTAFSAEILRIANSPLIAFPKAITSVLQASMLLGFLRLKKVVLTLGLKAYLQEQFTPAVYLCWRHSIASALIAEHAAKWTPFDADFAHTAAVMHDIGRIALAASMPAAYGRVIETSVERPRDLLEVEREHCGIDHCQAGRSLVSTWGLPDTLVEVIGCHHDPETPWRGAASLLPPSCILADWLSFGVATYRSLGTYAEILGGFPALAREHFPVASQDLAAQIGSEIRMIESA